MSISRSSWPKPLTTRTPGDGFVDDTGDLAGALQRVPLCRIHLLAQPERHHEQRRNGQEGEQREQRRHQEHEEQRQHEQHDVAGEHRHELEQLLHELKVGAGARHELPGGQLVVACEVETLESFEQRVPQVVLDVDAVAPARVPPDVLEDEVHRGETDEQHEQRADRLGLRGDRVVDDRSLHQRHDRRDDLAEDGDTEGDQHALLVAHQEGPQLPDPARLGSVSSLCGGDSSRHRSLLSLARAFARPAHRARRRAARARRRRPTASAHVGEEGVEPLAHRALGDAQRLASGRSDGEPDRAPVAVDGGALHEPVGDQRLDRRRHRGAGERELPGEAARALFAAAR